jgi:hypothetical protein
MQKTQKNKKVFKVFARQQCSFSRICRIKRRKREVYNTNLTHLPSLYCIYLAQNNFVEQEIFNKFVVWKDNN